MIEKKPWKVINLKNGARIKIGQEPNIFGAGLSLLLEMQDPTDVRQAWVLLDDDERELLIKALEAQRK